MVSRRYFVIIFILMAAIFFLFQFSEVAKDAENDYEINQYEQVSIPEKDVFVPNNGTVDNSYEDGDFVVFVGKTDSDIGSIVSQWALYSKRNFMECPDIKKFSVQKNGVPEFVIVDSASVDFDKDLGPFKALVDSGVSMVFANLPDTQTISDSEELRDFFGISVVRDGKITVDGMKLFSGFLLGGEVIYEPTKESEEKRQDLDLTMPWYSLSGGTKTYMVGLLDDYFDEDYEYKNDMYPAVIWRNSKGEGQIFCINGDYLSDTMGIGILSACIYELSSYQLYPVVNAQNTLLASFPVLTDENSEEMMELYSRHSIAFQSEVAWPTLIGFREKNDLKYTCLLSPKYNYEDEGEPSFDYYSSFLKLFNEEEAEIGASLQYKEGSTDLNEKVLSDQEYYDELNLKYTYTSAFIYLDDLDEIKDALDTSYLKNVRTIACDEDVRVPILSYLTDDITLQSLTSNTKDFFYSRDLCLKSVETALGYDNAELNIGEILWPEDDSDRWEVVYNDMSSSLSTYWKPFRVFDQTTLTESDKRVRTFLNLNCSSLKSGDEIILNIEGRGSDTAYFILRTHGDLIESIEGGTYEKIEDYAYLISADEDTVKICVKTDKNAATIQ